MVLANPVKTKLQLKKFTNKTKQNLICLILLCFNLFSNVSAQTSDVQSRREFDNGNYLKAIAIAKSSLEKKQRVNDYKSILSDLEIIASSQISLQNYKDAQSTLDEALGIISRNEISPAQKARIYLTLGWLSRVQLNNSAKAFEFGRKALAAAPDDRQVLGEYYLNIGRTFFSSGYDYSAIIWLEKAEKIFETEKTNSAKLDTYRFLSLAWSSRLNYQKALEFSEKLMSSTENTEFKYKYRQALFESATILSITGQKQKTFARLEKGLKLSVEQKNMFQACLFLTSLALNSLDEDEVNKASDYLRKLEQYNADNQFDFEVILGKAIISAFQGQSETSETLFAQLAKMKTSSEYIVPYWKLTIAERNKDWEKMAKINEEILAITEKENFRDGLPQIYLNFAKAYFELGQPQKSLENLEKSISLVEEIRQSESSGLSLGVLETYHKAYRLLSKLKADKMESFELADFLKARLLKDKINNAVLNPTPNISKDVQQKLEALTLKYIEDQSNSGEIEKIEKSITAKIPELDLKKTDLSGLSNIPALDDSAVISYFFTLDKKLMAFVWEKGKPLRIFNLPISEDEVEIAATTTQRNIKNRIFFKRDGKVLYDKLLKPLSLTGKHLIIIPDKSLWKIPFQALSSDGEKYLIEEKLISYAPSVSILLEQLKNPKPYRQTLQAFANSTFENKVLQFANAESTTVAGIYDSKPIINATVADFEQRASSTDLMHFSMHARVDNEQPLDSYLGFRKFGKDDGRLTVEELLNIKLKKGSLIFLASCDTNTVLSGEGLVSLAWAMMGAGATTVISSGWEANDKSTAVFTGNFYRSYRQGSSAAGAMQKAALELIKDKSGDMHEPYYWADFALNGDFR